VDPSAVFSGGNGEPGGQMGNHEIGNSSFFDILLAPMSQYSEWLCRSKTMLDESKDPGHRSY
jgi:hypothetical protein